MYSIKVLPPNISSFTREILYDLLLQREESCKKKDFQMVWMEVQNIILQKKLVSSCDDCLSLKKEVSFLKEDLALLQKKYSSIKEVSFLKEDLSLLQQKYSSIKEVNREPLLLIKENNSEKKCIMKSDDLQLVIFEKDTFLSTFDDSIRRQYEKLEEEFLPRVKEIFKSEDNDEDHISFWEIGEISPRLLRELYFDKKNNTYWENKDGKITYFSDIFNKINHEFVLIVNSNGDDGYDAIIRKTNSSK
jgi:hypothetical protein